VFTIITQILRGLTFTVQQYRLEAFATRQCIIYDRNVFMRSTCSVVTVFVLLGPRYLCAQLMERFFEYMIRHFMVNCASRPHAQLNLLTPGNIKNYNIKGWSRQGQKDEQSPCTNEREWMKRTSLIWRIRVLHRWHAHCSGYSALWVFSTFARSLKRLISSTYNPK
jgi:hypothetical protein